MSANRSRRAPTNVTLSPRLSLRSPQDLGVDLKIYLETMGAKVKIRRGNYARIVTGVEEAPGGIRKLTREGNGRFVVGHAMGGDKGGEEDSIRFDYFIPKRPFGVSDYVGYSVSNLGGVCIVSEAGGDRCFEMFTSIYGRLTSTTEPHKVPSPTVIQNGHDYTDRAVIMKAMGWGEVVRDANERDASIWEESRRRLEGVKKYLDENNNVEIPPSVHVKYNLCKSLLLSAQSHHSSSSYSTYHALATLAKGLVTELEEEHRLMPMLHFPTEHKIAVLAPVWAPLVLPILLGGVREWRRYKEKKAKLQ